MHTALSCRGRRVVTFLAVAVVFGWGAASSRAAIPPTFNLMQVVNSPSADPASSGPSAFPAAIPPVFPPAPTPPAPTPPVIGLPPVESPPPVVQPPPVVSPPPVVQPPPVVPPPPVSVPQGPPIPLPPQPGPAAESPEPTTLVMGMIGSGIAGILAVRRRRTRPAEE